MSPCAILTALKGSFYKEITMSNTITTKLGRISGVDMGSYTVFKGVLYAKPPVDELRFKAPQPLEPWEGVFEAKKFNDAPLQQLSTDDPLWGPEFYSEKEWLRAQSEDCLYINIWVPNEIFESAANSESDPASSSSNTGKKLPVAFWIHGGAFLSGYSTEKEFDGEAYCKRGVILVSVEYRCNIFGFLAHPLLTAESPDHTSGNYGILDQIAALKWIYENIGSFGGDSENITVFGQSAGAMSVQTLISSPLTDKMIARAIMQSGGGYNGGLSRDMLLSEQEKYGEMFMEVAGISTLEELRSLSADKILSLLGPFMGKVFPIAKGLFLTPVIDDHLLTDGYDSLIEKGSIKDIPYLLGSTKNDITVTEEMLKEGSFSPVYNGCTNFSKKLEDLCRKPAYVYYFAHDLPGDDAGAFHSSELWYMFGTLERCWRPFTEADKKLSERMLDYWTNFMKTGDPNGEGLEKWEPYRADDEFIMEF